ncbi:fam-a protein [Plasmodium vinckei lentum]|uniref:Fam-a protein n=1 Tax=Plasmodium vinckei lentum TaxID=138297 RepID=A0A6V7RYS4_PLAVN|nr:fam-a protein [Plasmodium vinckei lentum]
MDKCYIKAALFLLNLFAYMNNNALATELAPKKSFIKSLFKKSVNKNNDVTSPNNISNKIDEPSDPLICTNPDEIKKVEKLMSEAIEKLQEHGIHSNDYSLYQHYDDDTNVYYKKYKHLDIQKIDTKVYNTDKYEDVINRLFTLNDEKHYGYLLVKGKIVREYNPNLVMIQHRYINLQGFKGYFYAIAGKHEVSEDTTVIALASANINDYNEHDQNFYRNSIIESANSFETEVNSEKDIRKGLLNKMYIHLSGYIIKKKSQHIQVTSIHSMEMDTRNAPKPIDKEFTSDRLIIMVHAKLDFSRK